MEASNLNTNKEKDFQWRIRLGTVLGFPFFFHLSFLLWFIGLFWIEKNGLILFVSLLVFSISVHELAHAFVCRWLGLGGGTLTIWFLGGYFLPFSQVSLFDMNRSQRFRYILMIFAGPLSNVLLSGFFLSLAYITSMEAFYVAARYNLTLAIINLLPVGMLDGGRILTYLASAIVNWRKAVFITGILCLVLATSVFVAIFSDHWISRYSSWAGFLISMGITTINESRKLEDEIRIEAENQVSKEMAFVEETNNSNTWLVSAILAVAMASMLIFSVWYLSYYYMLYRNMPGRIVYDDYDSDRNGSLYSSSSMGFPAVKAPRVMINWRARSSSINSGRTVFSCVSSQHYQSTSLCILDRQGNFIYEIPLGGEFDINSVLISPSGNLVAYSSGEKGVGVIDIVTKEIKRFSVGGILEAWSPDENYILIITHVETGEILKLDLREDSVVLLTHNPDSYLSPTFSQDGKRIYYALGTIVGDSNLFRMDVDGSNLVNIVLGDTVFRYSKFRLSPDNSRIVFECGIDGDVICVANVDGSHLNRITKGNSPVWSPDGKYLAYVSEDDSRGIFVIRSDGKLPYKVKTTNTLGNYLEWVP